MICGEGWLAVGQAFRVVAASLISSIEKRKKTEYKVWLAGKTVRWRTSK